MYKKAKYFHDNDTARKILLTSDPYQLKKLGRGVKPFNRHQWMRVAQGIMLEGNMAKYKQNPSLKAMLLSTGSSILAESSAYDKIWGTGYFPDHRFAKEPSKWIGTNLLGQVLMTIRKHIRMDMSK